MYIYIYTCYREREMYYYSICVTMIVRNHRRGRCADAPDPISPPDLAGAEGAGGARTAEKGKRGGGQSGQDRSFGPALLRHAIGQVGYGRGRKGKHKCWKQSLVADPHPVGAKAQSALTPSPRPGGPRQRGERSPGGGGQGEGSYREMGSVGSQAPREQLVPREQGHGLMTVSSRLSCLRAQAPGV